MAINSNGIPMVPDPGTSGSGSSSVTGTNGGGGVPSPIPVGGTNSLPIIDPATINAGSSTVQTEVGGNLGSRFINYNTFALTQLSLRQNASYNGASTINLRFMGHRESNKFNLMIQKALSSYSTLLVSLRAANTGLQNSEVNQVYPLNSEISNYYHAKSQIEFKEWLLLKDSNTLWFR